MSTYIAPWITDHCLDHLFRFDILVNGGGSMTLTFQRHPFKAKQATLMVPWNRLVMLDVVTMVLEGEHEPVVKSCPHVSHDHYVMRPVVLSTWQHTQLGSCPEQSKVIPESQVINVPFESHSSRIFSNWNFFFCVTVENKAYRKSVIMNIIYQRSAN